VPGCDAYVTIAASMPRIELWMTVFAGLAGGLAGVLWSGLVTTRWLAGASHTETAARILAGAVLRGAAGRRWASSSGSAGD